MLTEPVVLLLLLGEYGRVFGDCVFHQVVLDYQTARDGSSHQRTDYQTERSRRSAECRRALDAEILEHRAERSRRAVTPNHRYRAGAHSYKRADVQHL